MHQELNNLKRKAHAHAEAYKHVVADDPYRLHYHLMPPVGLLNDPNGFIYFKGKYHIFYQWNPFETAHGAKFWGHYISEDLVHWDSAPAALAPDQWYDKNGCYSGSAVVSDGELYLFYTGNVKDEAGNRESYQCVATSQDGIHFEKKGPVIHVPAGYTAHFRDPKVFRHENNWYMVIGAQTEAEEGLVVLYFSEDLLNWNFLGPITGSRQDQLGDFGYMWECPDLFPLGDKDVLIVSPQGLAPQGIKYQNVFQTGYFSGEVDYQNVRYQHGAFTELDRGFDFYAPQTTLASDGRRLLFGWMGNSEEGDARQPTHEHEWIHALTLPRELEWKDGRLYQKPVRELKHLRKDNIERKDVTFESANPVSFEGINGKVFELEVSILDWNARSFSIKIGKAVKIRYDKIEGILSLEREGFTPDKEMETRKCYLQNLHHLQVYKDTSSIEVFVNHGEEVFSARIFDEPDAESIVFQSDGQLTASLNKWNLDRITEF
ncbi:sucrose-6-phosphate hydrolase [Virgibacillus sp. MSP4-1]|uniref:glycoside hydrolase family 32 protein n=1 Tax=Virgibacillus sp. MSP4-1 TaxID=2700081 RepID=UPI0003AB132A|nr:sucrose-6-phosphate hydrolase [Virgibacillus sp. MSP4-1]QHS21837.1 sucrose-6-phosphate hydrolase [Virgibacillus sp. MSP4-1]